MADFKKFIKNFMLFNEPEQFEKNILREKEDESLGKDTQEKKQEQEPQKKKKNTGLLLNKSKKWENGKEEGGGSQEDGQDPTNSEISSKLTDNLEYMKKRYSIPTNGDIVLREFSITIKDKVLDAFIMFYDGMVDRKIVNDNIVQSLMLLSNLDVKGDGKDLQEFVKNRIVTHNQLLIATKYSKVVDEINFGGCGIFIDGINVAFTADVKGWEHRTIGRPNTELVLRGPQEGFNEILRMNTALIRKILKDEDLISEDIQIGRRNKMPVALMYIKDIANEKLVDEVRKRLKSIKVDYILDSGELEQFIEDNTLLPAPQVIATERPDRVASLLAEGKVAIAMHGSPFVLVVPATLTGHLHSSEDAYIRFPYANFLRLIRIAAILMALLLPGMYVAITNYHHEMVPTDLLLAIEASRERVPFPSVVEILIMELAFEMIREAGIRIPGPIGPTLGIIGALILGQAAVAANIVSPILIIVVAVTGIGSFAIPSFSLGYSFRALRFGYIFLGALAGFLGITLGLFIQGLFYTQAKSFGVPFMVPFGPKTKRSWMNELTRAPIWKQESRPDFLNTKNEKKQPKISRKWLENKEKKGENDEE